VGRITLDCTVTNTLVSTLIIWIPESPEVGHLAFSKDVMDEGDFAQLVCSVVRGDEPFSITWSLQGDIVSSEPGLTTTQIGSRTSMLMIDAVGPRHVGIYTCNVSNKAGSAKASAKLNVNGTFAERGSLKYQATLDCYCSSLLEVDSYFKFQNHL